MRERARSTGEWYWDKTKHVQKDDCLVIYYQKRKWKDGKRINMPASEGGTRKKVLEYAR